MAEEELAAQPWAIEKLNSGNKYFAVSTNKSRGIINGVYDDVSIMLKDILKKFKNLKKPSLVITISIFDMNSMPISDETADEEELLSSQTISDDEDYIVGSYEFFQCLMEKWNETNDDGRFEARPVTSFSSAALS